MSTIRLAVVFAIACASVGRSASGVCAPSMASTDVVKVLSESGEAAAPIETVIIPMKHASAKSLSSVLGQFFGSMPPDSRPHFVYEPRTNSIIASGTSARLDLVRELVSTLDAATPQDEVKKTDTAMRTRLQLMIYEVALPRDRLSGVNVKELTDRSESPQSLGKALEKLGDSKLVYRADQILDSDRKLRKTTFGASAPIVRGKSVSSTGQKTSSINYQDIGLIVNASGTAQSEAGGAAELRIEFNGVAESNVEIGDDVMAPVMRNFEQNFNGNFTAGRPIILLLVDAQGEGDAVAYVTRIQFDIEPI